MFVGSGNSICGALAVGPFCKACDTSRKVGLREYAFLVTFWMLMRYRSVMCVVEFGLPIPMECIFVILLGSFSNLLVLFAGELVNSFDVPVSLGAILAS